MSAAPAGRDAFALFIAPLVGMPVSRIWRGHGSAMFFEFGKLRPHRRRDGTPGEGDGEMSLMVEWSWRIEGKRTILAGSWSEEKKWPRALRLIDGASVAGATLFARLPELELTFSNGVRFLSFMTAEGDPHWALFDRRGPRVSWLRVQAGALCFESGDPPDWASVH